MRNGPKEARIYNITLFVTQMLIYVHYGTTVIYTISHEMHVQQDAGGYCYISPFMVEEYPRYIIIEENVAFCVR